MDIKSITAGRKRRPFEDRFWEKVKRGAVNECWEWQAAKTSNGYGRLTSGRRNNLKAHRVAYALANGGFVDDKTNILHRCDNPPCCNPAHLFSGTKRDNTQDMIAKGRNYPPPHYFGANHHATKFNEVTARKIISDPRTLKVIAADHDVSWMTIFRLKHGKTWKQLT